MTGPSPTAVGNEAARQLENGRACEQRPGSLAEEILVPETGFDALRKQKNCGGSSGVWSAEKRASACRGYRFCSIDIALPVSGPGLWRAPASRAARESDLRTGPKCCPNDGSGLPQRCADPACNDCRTQPPAERLLGFGPNSTGLSTSRKRAPLPALRWPARALNLIG